MPTLQDILDGPNSSDLIDETIEGWATEISIEPHGDSEVELILNIDLGDMIIDDEGNLLGTDLTIDSSNMEPFVKAWQAPYEKHLAETYPGVTFRASQAAGTLNFIAALASSTFPAETIWDDALSTLFSQVRTVVTEFHSGALHTRAAEAVNASLSAQN